MLSSRLSASPDSSVLPHGPPRFDEHNGTNTSMTSGLPDCTSAMASGLFEAHPPPVVLWVTAIGLGGSPAATPLRPRDARSAPKTNPHLPMDPMYERGFLDLP